MKVETVSLLSSLDKPLHRFERLLFFGSILFLPTQLGKHFWPSFSSVQGIRVDYLSPTLSVTDILLLLLFCVVLVRFFTKKATFSFSRGTVVICLLLLLSLLISSSIAAFPVLAYYGLGKILLFTFFGWYVSQHASEYWLILLALSCGLLFENVLVLVQFLQQASVNGLFYWFGERTFTIQTPGIATASLDGFLVLRPYGTFPHPNVLAGYLLVGMTIVSSLFFQKQKKVTAVVGVVLLFSTAMLLLTMSRVSILVWFGTLLLIFFVHSKKRRYFFLLSVGILVSFAAVFLLTPLHLRFLALSATSESVVFREQLISASLQMIGEHPVFGIGLLHFIPMLPEYTMISNVFLFLQPVHNIFLLFAVEAGLVGLFFASWFLIRTFFHGWSQRQVSPFGAQPVLALLAICVLGMFDHYFLTLQQGQLLLAFTLGLCWSGVTTTTEEMIQ